MVQLRLEPNLTKEQLVKLYLSYKKYKEEELEKAHNNPLWQEVKDYVNSIKPELYKYMKNKIINPNKLTVELG